MISRRSLFGLFGFGAALPAVESVRSMKLNEGDTIVLSCAGPVVPEAGEQIVRAMQTKFPGHKCILLSDGLKIEVLRK